MSQRTARKGPKSGQVFWGCTSYPDCKGTLAIVQPGKSGPSSAV
jgi:ssDNA-binding Zn-finger/Zn-ribbon topoisomerase 1